MRFTLRIKSFPPVVTMFPVTQITRRKLNYVSRKQ